MTTVTEGLRRAGRLIPFRAAGSSQLTGDYGAVCSPWQRMPAQFQQAQRDRTEHYMTVHDGTQRSKPDHAVRYYVTSYGVPVAWVTLDGRTHYAELFTPLLPGTHSDRSITARHNAMVRHQAAIRAQWPERFTMDSMGDPVGPWPLGHPVP